jgi:hypothetical protein
LRIRRQAELARRSSPPRQYFVLDEAAIRRHIGIKKDRNIMPAQLRHIVAKAEQDELVTIRVIPFGTGAHPGLFGPFTLLEFNGGLSDVLYLDPGRGAFNVISGSDPQLAEYADDFENLLEDALPADKSIEFIRSAAEELS